MVNRSTELDGMSNHFQQNPRDKLHIGIPQVNWGRGNIECLCGKGWVCMGRMRRLNDALRRWSKTSLYYKCHILTLCS